MTSSSMDSVATIQRGRSKPSECKTASGLFGFNANAFKKVLHSPVRHFIICFFLNLVRWVSSLILQYFTRGCNNYIEINAPLKPYKMKFNFTLAVFFFISVNSFSQPGYPQPSFGGTGTVTTHVSDDFFRQGQSIAIQSNGFIVVAAGQVIVRYKPDGTLDPTFDGDGILNTGVTIADLALQTDGKIIMVASTSSIYFSDFVIYRYNTDGTSDTSFGTNGK